MLLKADLVGDSPRLLKAAYFRPKTQISLVTLLMSHLYKRNHTLELVMVCHISAHGPAPCHRHQDMRDMQIVLTAEEPGRHGNGAST